MDNQLPPAPESQPSAPEVTTQTATPPTEKPKPYGRNWKKWILIYIAIAIVLYSGIYYLVLAKKESSKPYSIQKIQSTPTASNSTITPPESGKESLSVITTPLNFKRSLKFILTVPQAWRTTQAEDAPQRFDAYNDNLAILKFLAFPQDPRVEDSGLKPENKLGFYDVTTWQEHSFGSKGVPEPSPGPSSEDKKSYFNFLINLRKNKDISDFSQCKDIFQTCHVKVGTQYVESADKVLSGFATIRTSPQSFQYDPTAYVYMAGVIDGKTIYVDGRFALHDKLEKEISKLDFTDNNSPGYKATGDAIKFKDGLPSDTKQLYDVVLDVVKSLRTERIN